MQSPMDHVDQQEFNKLKKLEATKKFFKTIPGNILPKQEKSASTSSKQVCAQQACKVYSDLCMNILDEMQNESKTKQSVSP